MAMDVEMDEVRRHAGKCRRPAADTSRESRTADLDQLIESHPPEEERLPVTDSDQGDMPGLERIHHPDDPGDHHRVGVLDVGTVDADFADADPQDVLCGIRGQEGMVHGVAKKFDDDMIGFSANDVGQVHQRSVGLIVQEANHIPPLVTASVSAGVARA